MTNIELEQKVAKLERALAQLLAHLEALAKPNEKDGFVAVQRELV